MKKPLTEKEVRQIIEAVKPHRITAETVRRVEGGDWQRSHPVDSAILHQIDRHTDK